MFHPPCLSAVRTLHPLVLPARVSDPLPGDRLRRGLYVGAQTTGFDPRSDAVIELGLLPFTYTVGGRIVDVFHDAAQVHRNDPQRAVTPPIVAFTGQTGADLRGASVDVPAATALIVAADLIVAHDAEFARPFVERVLPVAREVAWACSQREVPWAKAGFLSVALHCLACAFGVYAPDPTGWSRDARSAYGSLRALCRARVSRCSRRFVSGRSSRRCGYGRCAPRSRPAACWRRAGIAGCRKTTRRFALRGGRTLCSRGRTRRSTG